MEPTKLARMVNQIAANLDSGSDESKTVVAVADHLRRFWSPLMLNEIAQHMAEGDADLSAISEQAVNQLIDERRSAS